MTGPTASRNQVGFEQYRRTDLYFITDSSAGPINSIDQVFSAPYAAEKGLVRQVRHMTAGDIPTVANPVNFSHNPVQYRFAPPELGQHTTDILGGELGIEPAELQSLRDDGVI